MCVLCNIQAAAEAARPCMTPQNAVRALALGHREGLSRQLANSPIIATALFGEIPAEGVDVEMVLNGDALTGKQTLDVRIPDGEKGVRITYEISDYTACVNYTGNGPDGQSRIGVDAIMAALEFASNAESRMEAMMHSGILAGTGANVQSDLDMTRLVKRCLTALREVIEKDSSTE